LNLVIKRTNLLANCTIGHLWIDGVDTGLFTLEPTVRDVKIYGKTAIPYGTYQVVVDYSEHFLENLPHIMNVPNFVGVRIHPGNTDQDTEGCVLLGMTWDGGDFIGDSRKAFYSIFPKIQAAAEVTLDIIGPLTDIAEVASVDSSPAVAQT
jgi:hypothetical protein